jgi:uncharacterized membrane protein YkgB
MLVGLFFSRACGTLVALSRAGGGCTRGDERNELRLGQVTIMSVDPGTTKQTVASCSAQSPARSPTLLRWSLGIVYFFFGFIKFYPDLSPAELLAGQTIMRLSHNTLDAQTALKVLAVVECLIGLGFLFNVFMRGVFVLFLVHMVGTFIPLIFLPELTFKFLPFAPTLEGQYILKNLIFVAAGWTVLLPYVLSNGRGRGDAMMSHGQLDNP